jgi:hypothetical protein
MDKMYRLIGQETREAIFSRYVPNLGFILLMDHLHSKVYMLHKIF